MNQPNFSAVRPNTTSGLNDNQSLGVTGFGTAMHDYGIVTLHFPYTEGISGSSGAVTDPNQYSPSLGSPSRALTSQLQFSQGHPELSEYTHNPHLYPPTTVSDFSLSFSSEPPGAMAASSFAARSWLSKDIQQRSDVVSLLYHPPTGATLPHLPPLRPT